MLASGFRIVVPAASLGLLIGFAIALAAAGSEREKALAAEPSGDVAETIDQVDSVQLSPHDQTSDSISEAAVVEATRILDRSPHDLDALLERGAAYLRLKEFEKSEKDLAAAVEVAPNDSNAWWSYGALMLVSGRPERAVKYYDHAIALGLKDPKAFTEKGWACENLGKYQQAISSFTQALELNPKLADALASRGECWSRQGNRKGAITDITKAISLAPNVAFYYGLRGSILIANKEFEEGIADVWKAIELSDGDAGADYRPSTDKALSTSALRHGEEQLRRMLNDRPTMAEHLSPGDKLWTWATRKFAGEDTGFLVNWNATPPPGALGFSHGPSGDKPAYISVAKIPNELVGNKELAFDWLWSVAAFELHNVALHNERVRLGNEVTKGRLARDEYVSGKMESEEVARERTRAFYLKFYLPWLLSKGLDATSPSTWGCEDFGRVNSQVTLASRQEDHRWPYYDIDYHFLCISREHESDNEELAEMQRHVDAILERSDLLSAERLAEVQYWQGYLRFVENDLDQAIKEFGKVLAAFPSHEMAMFMRGVALFNSDLVNEAIDDWTRVLNANPNSADAYLWRGMAWIRLEQYDKAIADFDDALKLRPKWEDAYVNRAVALVGRDEFDAAIKDLSAAINHNSQSAELYWRRGNVRTEINDLSHAINDFSEAIRLAPQEADGYIARGGVRRRQGELDSALLDLNAAIELSSDDAMAYAERGYVHLLNRKYEEALSDFAAAIERDPALPESYLFRAKLYLESKNPGFVKPKEAIEDATRSCELTKWESSEALSLLARAFAANKDFVNAIRWEKRSLELCDKDDRPSHEALLRAYEQSQEDAK